MKTTQVSLTSSDQSDGFYFVYFWIANVTDPTEEWEAVTPLMHIVSGLKKTDAKGPVANVHITALKDKFPQSSVKIEVMPAGTRREDAEKWIDTAPGKQWSEGIVGATLCAVVLAIAQ